MKMNKLLLCLLGALALGGCTSMSVNHIDSAKLKTETICIEDNPKVTIPDFNRYLEHGFARHQIQTRTYGLGIVPDTCPYTLKYTALRSWDFTTYLSFVRLELFTPSQEKAADVEWTQGGAALNKWRSSESKVYDLIDQLLNMRKEPKTN